jgi:GTPase SAR1 family protein
MNRLTLDEQEKLRTFKNAYIERIATPSIVGDFERLRENQVIGGKQICMLLTGDTGAGKTSFIDYYKENFIADADSPRTTKVSVLISRIPPRPSLETTILELLKDLGQFGTAYRLKDNRALNLTAALVGLLKKCKVELIILDEFQELIEYLSEKKRNDIANRLKLISEDAGVPIVLVGMP